MKGKNQEIAKYEYDLTSGKIVPLNDEAREVIAKIESRPRQKNAESIRNINESAVALGPGWVKVPITSPLERSQMASFRALGFTEAESKIAASGVFRTD
jgi:hypothetical protein